jgi:hypothetical protein
MGDSEDGSEKDAHATDDNVRNAEERVSATHHGPCRDDNRFGSFVLPCRKV